MFWLLILLLCVLFIGLLLVLAIHLGFRAPREPNQVQPSEAGLVYQAVEFDSASRVQLSAWWLPAQSQSTHSIVMIHGWGSNRSALLPLAKSFVAAHWNVLMVDAHNHGDSEGKGDSTMPKFSLDLDAGIAWLKQAHPQQSNTIVAVGHSVGAAATLLSAARTHSADGYIAIASFAHPRLMMQRYLGGLAKIPFLSQFILSYVQWAIGHNFDDIAPVNSVQKVQAPVLCLHGNQDSVIPVDDHYWMCQQANRWVECVEIDGADHDSIELIDQHFPVIEKFLQAVREEKLDAI